MEQTFETPTITRNNALSFSLVAGGIAFLVASGILAAYKEKKPTLEVIVPVGIALITIGFIKKNPAR